MSKLINDLQYHSHCIECGKALSDEKSVYASMGQKCLKSKISREFSLPEKTKPAEIEAIADKLLTGTPHELLEEFKKGDMDSPEAFIHRVNFFRKQLNPNAPWVGLPYDYVSQLKHFNVDAELSRIQELAQTGKKSLKKLEGFGFSALEIKNSTSIYTLITNRLKADPSFALPIDEEEFHHLYCESFDYFQRRERLMSLSLEKMSLERHRVKAEKGMGEYNLLKQVGFKDEEILLYKSTLMDVDFNKAKEARIEKLMELKKLQRLPSETEEQYKRRKRARAKASFRASIASLTLGIKTVVGTSAVVIGGVAVAPLVPFAIPAALATSVGLMAGRRTFFASDKEKEAFRHLQKTEVSLAKLEERINSRIEKQKAQADSNYNRAMEDLKKWEKKMKGLDYKATPWFNPVEQDQYEVYSADKLAIAYKDFVHRSSYLKKQQKAKESA